MNVGVVIGTWTGGRARSTFRLSRLTSGNLSRSTSGNLARSTSGNLARSMPLSSGAPGELPSDGQDRSPPDSLRVFGPLLENTFDGLVGLTTEP